MNKTKNQTFFIEGVCHTDNDSLFGKLGGYLKKNVGCYRAFLNAEDCPSKLKTWS